MINSEIQTVVLEGKRFVILPESDYARLAAGSPGQALPPLPAVASMREILARDIVRDRKRAGWSQAELARRAGIRVETLNRIETGKRSPAVSTIEKIDAALSSLKRSKK